MTDQERTPRVKVCGLTRRADVELACGAGADYVGVILIPGTPRRVSPREARGLVEGVNALPVAVVADLEAGEAADLAGAMGAAVIQLHGQESPDLVARLGEAGPWSVWKAIRIREAGDVQRGLSLYGQAADGLLLDAWDAGGRGGTGRSFSWREAEPVVRAFPPGLLFVAAGGLRPENVLEAIRIMAPHVVDVSSGVEESPGIKDVQKVQGFMHAVRTLERGRSP